MALMVISQEEMRGRMLREMMNDHCRARQNDLQGTVEESRPIAEEGG